MSAAAEVVVRVVGKTIQKCKSRRQKRKQKKRKMRNNANRLIQTGHYHENDWFWHSYQRAIEWQGRHYIAYWRAKCVALQAENRALKDYIIKISSSNKNNAQLPGCSSNKTKLTQKEVKRKLKAKPPVPVVANPENKCTADETEDYNFEFEVTEEMLDFFEQSMRHRMERDRLKNAKEKESGCQSEEDEDSDTLPPKEPVGQQRIEEMKLLYGESAPMIIGMETALQLSFDRNVDKLQPPMWPNIPLKL